MTKPIQRLAVFCGASIGNRPQYAVLAEALAAALVKANIGLVYGGTKVGLMGVLGKEVMRLGGEVIGVIPEKLTARELIDPNITALHVVTTMQERKAMMSTLADGFIMLPGGIGTLDEFFEEMTAIQLGFHHKPCGILNIENYFDPLLQFLRQAVTENFYSAKFCEYLVIEQHPERLIERFQHYQPPLLSRWEEVLAAEAI